MRYGVRTKVRARVGDLIKFGYSRGSDHTPSILFLATVRAENGNKLIAGFNLKYLDTIREQIEVVYYARMFVRRDPSAIRLYNRIIRRFPKLTSCYRIWNVRFISNAKKYDFDLERLVRAT